jgi:hypothetical protein
MVEFADTRAPCRLCLRETKHFVVATRITESSEELDDGFRVTCRDTYELLECCGCESGALRHTSWFSGSGETDVFYYPPPVARAKPRWLIYVGPLTGPLQGLMEEIYAALHAGSRRLALMGARTVIDLVLSDKIGDGGTFGARLEMLEATGFVSRQSREILAAALDAGSAAAHRGFSPTQEDMMRVMDIVENILQALYVLGSDAAELRNATPPRSARGPANHLRAPGSDHSSG